MPVTLAAARRTGLRALALLLLLATAGLAAGEWAGWPFLAGPMSRAASRQLGRAVQMEHPAAAAGSGFRVHFLGGVRLHAPLLRIAAPAWSQAPHFLQAEDVTLVLRYGDLWRAWQGQRWRIAQLQAATLDAWLERQADGRASWQTGQGQPVADPSASTVPLPQFDLLQVDAGRLQVNDAPLAVMLDLRLTLVDGEASADSPAGAASSAPALTAASGKAAGGAPVTTRNGRQLRLQASGSYRQFPLRLELVSAGLLPWVAEAPQAVPVPLALKATVGRTELDFRGTALDALHLDGLSGRFRLRGPSLAAVGDPLGVTLPTTAAFHTRGRLVRHSGSWHVLVDEATVGASQLDGAFTYRTDTRVPLLAGRLGGKRLLLGDLAPALGADPADSARGAGHRRKLLPDRPFDLAALRVMDAQVAIAIDEVDLQQRLLKPLRPLHAQLRLAGGVLTLGELDARTGAGRLRGEVTLDGRAEEALWQARLAWSGVQLEQWLQLPRQAGAPPYVSGRLRGSAELSGQGRSTADILASLGGQLRTELRDGTVSHLALEAAGLDLAQGLGVFLKGDDALPVQCALVSLVAERGVLRPQVAVLDTHDSAVWADGSLSLANESLDLRLVVTPKDFSPLALRAPVRVSGSFAAPVVTLDRSVLGIKLAASVVLAFVNPLAALIPLIDPGDSEEARRGAAGCQPLVQRARAGKKG